MPPSVREKASALEVREASGEGPTTPGARVAWLLSLKDEPVRYLVHHLEDYRPAECPVGVRLDVWERFSTSAAAMEVLDEYLEICRRVHRWDVLDALCRCVEPVESRGGLLRARGRALASGAAPIVLSGPNEADATRRGSEVELSVGLDSIPSEPVESAEVAWAGGLPSMDVPEEDSEALEMPGVGGVIDSPLGGAFGDLDAEVGFLDLFDGFEDSSGGLAGAPGAALAADEQYGQSLSAAEAPDAQSPAPPPRGAGPSRARPYSTPAGPSLLGVLEEDFTSRLEDFEQRRTSAKNGADPRQADPDFQVLFRDYVVFRVGVGAGSWVGIGRRYRDVLFDLHRFDGEGLDHNAAVMAFLHRKLETGYAPQSLRPEPIPAGAEAPEPLTSARLERAFALLGEFE